MGGNILTINKKVITYGTFDLFHVGHYRLLERAKKLGDFLIVGITSEEYDKARGKLNVQQSLTERIENVRKTNLADLIIVEEYEGQKIEDIKKYNVDIFAIGSDWIGKFDYLKEYCEVVYLERTREISSTELRNKKFGILKGGIVGYGRIANRFVEEARYVSGINMEGVFGRNKAKADNFMETYKLAFSTTDYNELLDNVDVVYIATPHDTHYEYAKKAIMNGKHVLCEKPLTLSKKDTEELYNLSERNNVVLLEGIKTAYCPAFNRLINVVKTGIIGSLVGVSASFTKLVSDGTRELQYDQFGGSVTELASYVLLPGIKLFGCNYKDVFFYPVFDKKSNVDIFTTIILMYENNYVLNGTVGIKAKSEGSLIIAGTRGYIYVPSPWWRTEYFEIRNDNGEAIKRYALQFDGEGLRYEIAELVRLVQSGNLETHHLKREESITMSEIIEKFLLNTSWNKKQVI